MKTEQPDRRDEPGIAKTIAEPDMLTVVVHYVVRLSVYIFYCIYFRARWKGAHKIPRKGPVLLVANHASHLDPPAVAMSTSRRVDILAKRELFDNRAFGWLLRALGAYPIERGGSDRAALRLSIELLKNGHILLMFPEGTRSQDGQLREAQSGCGMLIDRIPEVTIIPVRVEGSFSAFPPKTRFPKPKKLRMIVGDPFTLEDLGQLPNVKKQLYQEIGKEIMHRIVTAAP